MEGGTVFRRLVDRGGIRHSRGSEARTWNGPSTRVDAAIASRRSSLGYHRRQEHRFVGDGKEMRPRDGGDLVVHFQQTTARAGVGAMSNRLALIGQPTGAPSNDGRRMLGPRMGMPVFWSKPDKASMNIARAAI